MLFHTLLLTTTGRKEYAGKADRLIPVVVLERA